MCLTYKVSPSQEQVRIVGKGKATTKELIESIRAIGKAARFDPKFNVIADFRELVYAPADPSEILRIAEALEGEDPVVKGNVAIIAKGNLVFSAVLLATHLRLTKSINAKVFSDPISAQTFCIKGRLASLSPAAQ